MNPIQVGNTNNLVPGVRVKLVEMCPGKSLTGFQLGDRGTVIKVNCPVNGYSYIAWDNGITSDSRNERIAIVPK
jgi:hypothetical protein